VKQILSATLLGGFLGIFDGLTAWFTPEVRAQMLGIVIGSTIKGLLTGVIIGVFARKVHSLALGMSDVSAVRFALLNIVGAAAWSIAIGALGWYVGSAANQLLGHLERDELGVAAAVVTVGLALWAWRRWVRDAA